MSDVSTVRLQDFRENPANPQTITADDFATLRRSVAKYPALLAKRQILWEGDHVINSGNKRFRALVYNAAEKQGLKIADLLKDIPEDEPHRRTAALLAAMQPVEVPAAWFADLDGLSDDERRKLIAIDNIQLGEVDPEKMLALYSKDEITEMMGEAALDDLLVAVDVTDVAGNTDPDAVPEPPAEVPKSRRGAVYQLGQHRVMCGDSTSADDVAKLMDGRKADLLVTDPPYNVDYKGSAGKIKNDNMGDDQFREFLTKAFRAADGALRPGAVWYIWHADLEGYNFRSACRLVGWQVRQCLMWVKDSLVLGRQDYQWRHEPCLYGWKDGAAHHWRSDRKQTTVIDLMPEKIVRDGDKVRFFFAGHLFECDAAALFEVVDGSVIPMPKPTRSADHPTMKPVNLFAYQIRNSANEGELVLDIFGGSGTTVIACEQSRRVARVMELDEKFVDVIRRRWAEFAHGEGCDWESLTPEVVM